VHGAGHLTGDQVLVVGLAGNLDVQRGHWLFPAIRQVIPRPFPRRLEGSREDRPGSTAPGPP
jgi:hypothetical protein